MQTKIFKFVHSVGVFSCEYVAKVQLSVRKHFEYCPCPQIYGRNKTEVDVKEGRTSSILINKYFGRRDFFNIHNKTERT